MPVSSSTSAKTRKPPVENAFTSAARPVSVTANPPAPTAKGTSDCRFVWAAAEKESPATKTARRAARASERRNRSFIGVIGEEDTPRPVGRKICILRIRRPARPRLESKAVPREEPSLTATLGRGFFAPLFEPLLALLVPSRCAVCEAPRADLGGGGVCRSCWASLPVLDAAAACPHCALPSGGSPCAACRLHPPAVTRTAAFGLYAGGLRTLHHAFKFAGWDLLAARRAPRRSRAGDRDRLGCRRARARALYPPAQS